MAICSAQDVKHNTSSLGCVRSSLSTAPIESMKPKIAPLSMKRFAVYAGLLAIISASTTATANATAVEENVNSDEQLMMPALVECSACDVPSAREIPFCAEYVGYSSCLTGESWTAMDNTAKSEYMALLNTTRLSSSDTPTDCTLSLRHVQCAKLFNVCEMGSPESFCLSSCSALVSGNCSTALGGDASSVRHAQSKFCGSSAQVALGVADGGKCFDANYEGPQRTAWVIGFSIAVVFSFLASVGINLQKRALKQNEMTAHEQNQEPLPAYRLPLWVMGFVLILAGSILDFVAFGLAPQSLLAPLAALTLVWNMMLAPCFNKEKLSRKDILATLVIFAGATIAVVFASHSSPSYNLSMLMHLYTDPLTIVYFIVVVCCVGVHYFMIQFVEKLSLTSRRHRLIQAGQPAVWSKMRLIGYAGLSGTMGGQSVLFAKSTAELIKAAFHGDDSFAHVQTYLIAIALVMCLLCQIHFLNCGLLHYDALSVVPIYQAYWIISGVLGGVIYFQEIRTFSVQQACMFVLGIMTTIFGVYLLSQRRPVAQASMKRRITMDRGKSFSSSMEFSLDGTGKGPAGGGGGGAAGGSLVTVPEVPAKQESPPRLGEPVAMPTINEHESEQSTTEDSDGDDETNGNNLNGESDNPDDVVSRHVIDNYLDMSATMCFSEILDGLGFQSGPQRMLLSRRPSARNFGPDGSAASARQPHRRSVDDIEVGLPAATRESMPKEKVPKRRSITFTSFQNQKKTPPPE